MPAANEVLRVSETFDPYRKWLGILPAEQPPDHYRLLGIVRFEDDADTISNAADRQMAHVRTFQTGPHSVLSQKLLNEIAAARVCLLDAAKKGEYDRQLRAKESRSAQPTGAAPTELVLRPIDSTPPAAPVARPAPPVTAWSQPPVGAVPRVPVPPARPPASVLTPADPTPVSLGPVARRPPPKIQLRKPRRERSDAHKTLLIAAGLAAITVAVFVAYKTRSGANSKVTRDDDAANQVVRDDAEKAREISESRGPSQSKVVVTGTVITPGEDSPAEASAPPDGPPPRPVVVASSTSTESPWAKLTRQLNDFHSWKAASGDWSEKEGRIYGQGDARLNFQEELPEAFLFSFEMKVVDGMRPRIFFGQDFHFGNEGYERTLYAHDDTKSPVVGTPRPYSTGVPLNVSCRVTEQESEFLVDGKLVARCGWKHSGPMKLTLSAGDWWSKGQVLFGPFTLGPAPPEPLTPPLSSSGSPSVTAKDTPWRVLFDGKSLAGWTGDLGATKVENSVLINRGKRAIVVAPGDYRDFELEIEFRLARDGNSGLGICYSGNGDPSQNGLEVQMIDDTANRRLQDIQRCGAVYGLAAAKPGHFKRWPEWNRFRVTSLDDRLQVELNGTLVVDTTRSLMKQANPQHPGVSRTSGKVCLFPVQGRSEYRNIRIHDK
ncbi:MAG TPA: DUF1080 domain-containing protein [Pirellulales bacterium]|nr:DUF1080 domain-containing protein [Pirellulales bacterium]